MTTAARRLRGALVGAASLGMVLGTTGPVAAQEAPAAASAQTARECTPSRGIPVDQVSIQMYTFAEYVGFGEDEATLERLRTVLAELADIGYRNVEPYTFNGLTAREYDALLDQYGLAAPSRHGSTDPAGWTQELRDSRVLGQEYTGSGGAAPPGLGSYTDTLATAATLDRLGRLSVDNGTGKVVVHNHQYEFAAMYLDPFTGEQTSAWELLVQHTDPRYVTYELDVLWAADAGVDVPRLIRQYDDRIELLHVKDGVGLDGGEVEQRALGEGELDLVPILRAARRHVQYYVVEQDLVFFGEVDTMLDEARTGFEYLDCVRN